MKLPYITVTAPPGVITPIHEEDGSGPSGQLRVTSADVAKVRYSRTTMRAIGRGDLIPCDMNGARVGVHLAIPPDDMESIVPVRPKKGASK